MKSRGSGRDLVTESRSSQPIGCGFQQKAAENEQAERKDGWEKFQYTISLHDHSAFYHINRIANDPCIKITANG